MVTPSFRPINGFDDLQLQDSGAEAPSSPLLQWYCPPDCWKITTATTDDYNNNTCKEVKGGWYKINHETGALLLAAPAKKDFWRKTYYEPLLVKDDAPFLFTCIAQHDFPIMVTTQFSLQARKQFDQAGIMIRLDNEHWIKTGIEVVDGIPRLSCVVTNGFSDWSTQSFTSTSVCIRVHCLAQNGGSYVVESAPYDSSVEDHSPEQLDQLSWSLVRICHLHRNFNHDYLNNHPSVQNTRQGTLSTPSNSIYAGIFAACPEDQVGTVATFHSLSIVQGSTFEHTADVVHDN